MIRRFSLFFLGAAWLLAQGPAFAPWWDSPIARDLKLSEDQRGKIRETVSAYRDQLIQERADVQKAEGTLEDLMNEDQVDQAKVAEAIDQLVARRGALMKTVSMMSLKLRMVLTPEQWKELQGRRPEGRMLQRKGFPRERRMDRRPGGPRNPDEPPPPGPGM